jgi:hypothetical protein
VAYVHHNSKPQKGEIQMQRSWNHLYENASKMLKLAISQGSFPQYVYKYKSKDPKNPLFLDNIIIKNEIYFSSPLDFNDAFDCQIEPDTTNNYDEILNWLKRISSGDNTIDVHDIAQKCINDPAYFNKCILKSIDMNKYGVLCLSKEANNDLLWGIYADGNKGVCLEFDMLQDPSFFSTCVRVHYSDKYPCYNHLTAKEGDLVQKLICTKNTNWDKEKELRIVEISSGIYQFQKLALSSIIFGLRTPPAECQRLIDLCQTNSMEHVKIMKVIKTHRSFKLNVVKYQSP